MLADLFVIVRSGRSGRAGQEGIWATHTIRVLLPFRRELLRPRTFHVEMAHYEFCHPVLSGCEQGLSGAGCTSRGAHSYHIFHKRIIVAAEPHQGLEGPTPIPAPFEVYCVGESARAMVEIGLRSNVRYPSRN